MRVRVQHVLTMAALAAAAGCAHPTPVANAPDLGSGPTAESLVQVAALGEVARTFAPNDTLYVERNTRELFASDTAADEWVAANREVITRVPVSLLTAYAHANVEGGPVMLPRSGVRGHPVAPPVVAPALATPRYQIFTLTRPGFSAGGDSAFIMVTRSCGNLCGRTDGVIVVRENNRWRVATTAWRVAR